MFMNTAAKQLGSGVEGSHVSPEEDVDGLLGMEPVHINGRVKGAPSINDPPFYAEISLLLLEFPNIFAQFC